MTSGVNPVDSGSERLTAAAIVSLSCRNVPGSDHFVRPGARTGIGLGSMHQRAAELGGACEVTGGPGTTVRATLPVGPA